MGNSFVSSHARHSSNIWLPPEINHPTLCFGGHGVTALPCLVIFWRKPIIIKFVVVNIGNSPWSVCEPQPVEMLVLFTVFDE